jgi:hypothetical protein
MVAERDNQRVTKERNSALILLANARVWESEGWQVSITDPDGKAFDPGGFEHWLAPQEVSPLQPANLALLEAPLDQPLAAEADEQPVEASETAEDAQAPQRERPVFEDVGQVETEDLREASSSPA